LLFLFGDTWSGGGVSRATGADSFARVDARLPFEAACEGMQFPALHDGGFDPITLDGHTLPTFNVPTGAYDTRGALYAFFTVADAEGNDIGGGGGRGVLGRSDDGGPHFVTVRPTSASSDRFNMVSAVRSPAHIPSLPKDMHPENVVLLYGTGAYRRSYPFLAVAEATNPERPWHYYGGLAPNHTPVWTDDEESAMALFQDDPTQACLGEMSVAFSPALARWIMLYNCRGRIYMRTAQVPWGGWSMPIVVFSRYTDGFGNFVHHPCGSDDLHCGDGDYSAAEDGHFGEGESGDVYAPYLIPDYFYEDAQNREHVVFTMSTWNPYTTVLMEAVVEKVP
jgi:hypothetical protein